LHVSKYEIKWNLRFEELKAFKEAHRHTSVPNNYGPLGTWVKHQRKLFCQLEKEMKSSLTPERRAKLDGIQFQFQLQPNTPWDERLEELKAFKKEYGNTAVPKSFGPLCHWVYLQRRQFCRLNAGEKSCMSDERREKLIGIQFK
jgi:hypothetical protein